MSISLICARQEFFIAEPRGILFLRFFSIPPTLFFKKACCFVDVVGDLGGFPALHCPLAFEA